MSQHDMVIDNGPGLGVRTDFNAALQALASTSVGPVEPPVTYAGQLWLNTSDLVTYPQGLLRQRNLANSGWVSVNSGSVVIDGTGNVQLPGASTSNPANVLTVATGLSLVKRTVVTASGAFNYQSGSKFALVEVQGGGGGGGPASSGGTQNQASAGPGGGSGGYVAKFITLGAIVSATLVVGAAVSGGNAGNNSSYTDGTNTLTAGGGGAGSTDSQSNSIKSLIGGVGGSATGGDINILGEQGGSSLAFGQVSPLVSIGRGGPGGDGKLGSGGRPPTFSLSTGGGAAGGNASAYGAGGAGGCAVNTATTQAGGSSSAGLIIITEMK